MLYLKEANMEDVHKEWEFITRLPEDENGFTNTRFGISEEKFVSEDLPAIIGYSKGMNLPKDFVPETDYFLWDNDEVVGLFRLRHRLNDFLRMYHGHIGYGVKAECRGKGYATEGLRQLIEKAKDIIDEEEIYLSVHKDDLASLKVQQKNGARIVREDDTNYYTRIPLENRALVRTMQPEDYEQVYDLWLSCKGMGLNNIDDSGKGILKFLERNPNTNFVAVLNGFVVGVIMTGHDGRRGHIYHTAVKPDFRRQGLATRLLKRAEESLQEEGITKVTLLVFGNNEGGNDFWEQNGYTVRNDVNYRNKALTDIISINT